MADRFSRSNDEALSRLSTNEITAKINVRSWRWTLNKSFLGPCSARDVYIKSNSFQVIDYPPSGIRYIILLCLSVCLSVCQYVCMYRASQKQSLQLLLIFQQCMQIFEWNFTQLLNNKIYTLSPTFVEIHLKTTNLYGFNHEPPFILQLRNVHTETVLILNSNLRAPSYRGRRSTTIFARIERPVNTLQLRR